MTDSLQEMRGESFHKDAILFSFRRCPYAIRARLAIASAGIPVELREIVLKNKPEEMLNASPKGTVPVLLPNEGGVLEESLDLIQWALSKNDPEGLLNFSVDFLENMRSLIAENDGAFKSALDRYKYPNRYDGADREANRELGAQFIRKLDAQLGDKPYLFSTRISHADISILPFVRQFAHVDREWFWAQEWSNVIRWLDAFLESDRFKAVMTKYAEWKSGEPGVPFGS